MENGAELSINDLTEVKALGIRFGHRGRVMNSFMHNWSLCAIQFPDNCAGYLKRPELEKIPPSEAVTDWEKGLGFNDVADLESRYHL